LNRLTPYPEIKDLSEYKSHYAVTRKNLNSKILL
jgi:hypothetical protein